MAYKTRTAVKSTLYMNMHMSSFPCVINFALQDIQVLTPVF